MVIGAARRSSIAGATWCLNHALEKLPDRRWPYDTRGPDPTMEPVDIETDLVALIVFAPPYGSLSED